MVEEKEILVGEDSLTLIDAICVRAAKPSGQAAIATSAAQTRSVTFGRACSDAAGNFSVYGSSAAAAPAARMHCV